MQNVAYIFHAIKISFLNKHCYYEREATHIAFVVYQALFKMFYVFLAPSEEM